MTRAESAGPASAHPTRDRCRARSVLLGRRAGRRADGLAGDDQLDHLHAAELVAVHVRRVDAVLAQRLPRRWRARRARGPGATAGRRGHPGWHRVRVGMLSRATGPEGRDVHRCAPTRPATHYVQLNFDGEKPDLPVMVSANASVTDVNRQSFASNLELLVHPSSLYVGIRSTQQFVREGEPIDVEAIVTDIDGKVVSGRTFTITATRVESEVRERDVGRHRRRSQALHGDVVDQAGVVLDQGRRRRSVQDLGRRHRRRRRAQPQRAHALGERRRHRSDAQRRAGERDRDPEPGHVPPR